MRGDGGLYSRNGIWWAVYIGPDGRKIWESTRTRVRREAETFLKNRMRAVENHRDGTKRFSGRQHERLPVKDLLEAVKKDQETRRLKGRRKAAVHVGRLLDFFEDVRAVDVDRRLIDKYIASRRVAAVSDTTIDRELELLRRAFKLAAESGGVAFGPLIPHLVKRHANARRGFLDRGLFLSILAKIPDRDFRDYLEWFSVTGMRPGEIGSLSWESYDSQTKTLRLAAADAKIGELRVVPIFGPLVPIIERRIAARRLDCRLIFHAGGKSFKSCDGGLPARYYTLWFDACAAVGLPGREDPARIIPYDLRRTATRNLRAAGVPEKVSMQITGHKTRETFDRYGIVDERDLSSAFQRVGEYVENLPPKSNLVALGDKLGDNSARRRRNGRGYGGNLVGSIPTVASKTKRKHPKERKT